MKNADEVSQKAVNYAAILKNKTMLATAVNNRGLMFLDGGKMDSESRIAYIDGTLDADTTPGKGVTYTIELPLVNVA